MTPFRGSDEQIEREIAAIEQIVRVRINRAARELRDLEKDLRELEAGEGPSQASRPKSTSSNETVEAPTT